jgi:hypothetical protein
MDGKRPILQFAALGTNARINLETSPAGDANTNQPIPTKNMNTPTRNQILNLMIDMGADADDAEEMLDWATWEIPWLADQIDHEDYHSWCAQAASVAKSLWRDEFPMHRRTRWQSNEVRDMILHLCNIDPDWDIYYRTDERCCMTLAKERAEMYL